MKVPKEYCVNAVYTACFLINIMPTPVLNGDTPYKVLFHSKSLFHIPPRLFGGTCYVCDVRPSVTKLDPKALKCVVLGYSRLQKAYHCYFPDLRKYLSVYRCGVLRTYTILLLAIHLTTRGGGR